MNTLPTSLLGAGLPPVGAAQPLSQAAGGSSGALLRAEVEPQAQGLGVSAHAQRVLSELLGNAPSEADAGG